MPNKHVYEYAVIRLVPKVEREEFFNVGLILFSKQARYIRVAHTFNTDKLRAFCADCDMEQLENNLNLFTKIGNGTSCGSPIAALDVAERFRWLTAIKSSAIQASRPHPGVSEDLDATFERLYEELVL
uniref:DUF3037 domain-containing protein n=1 Tax=Gelidibacter sp. TaxID=2018083 RepID=UPI00404B46C6